MTDTTCYNRCDSCKWCSRVQGYDGIVWCKKRIGKPAFSVTIDTSTCRHYREKEKTKCE